MSVFAKMLAEKSRATSNFVARSATRSRSRPAYCGLRGHVESEQLASLTKGMALNFVYRLPRSYGGIW